AGKSRFLSADWSPVVLALSGAQTGVLLFRSSLARPQNRTSGIKRVAGRSRRLLKPAGETGDQPGAYRRPGDRQVSDCRSRHAGTLGRQFKSGQPGSGRIRIFFADAHKAIVDSQTRQEYDAGVPGSLAGVAAFRRALLERQTTRLVAAGRAHLSHFHAHDIF